jgi:hypothetical protein
VSVTGRLGYCPQDGGVVDFLRPDEHFVLLGAGAGLSRVTSKTRGRNSAAALGWTAADAPIAKDLSGGTRQKLNLVMSTLTEPDVLLLDEPYQGFGRGTYVNFWDQVYRLRDEGASPRCDRRGPAPPRPAPALRSRPGGGQSVKVVVFGGTGMIGQAVLRECLLDPAVIEVVTVGRTATGREHTKLREIVHADLFDLGPVKDDLAGADACFFCLGVSSAGMSEDAYRRITYDLTMAAARLFAETGPDVTFVYVSGQGTDETEKGRTMWARVKGKTENDILALLPNSYMFRPGYIHPMNGEKPRSRVYAILLPIFRPLHPVLRRLFPKSVTDTESIGRAMLTLAKQGGAQRVLENPGINAAGAREAV